MESNPKPVMGPEQYADEDIPNVFHILTKHVPDEDKDLLSGQFLKLLQ